MRSAALGLLLAVLNVCKAYPTGPPVSVCESLRPHHPGSPTSGNGGFLISTDIPANAAGTGYDYAPGNTYRVVLTGTMTTFKGFAVQSVSSVDGSAVGNFTPDASSHQKLLACSQPYHTIVHYNPEKLDFTEQVFTWHAPDTAGSVNFLYSIVHVRTLFGGKGQYYVKLSAIAENPVPPGSTGEPLVPSTTDPSTPDQFTTDTSTTFTPPDNVIDPIKDPEDYRLLFRDPPSCSIDDCRIFVGIDTNEGNEEYLDFYIDGRASAWVAVGFSKTRSMFAADVKACNVNPKGEVEFLDTYNEEDKRKNVPDGVMVGVPFKSSVKDGRIMCSFAHPISGLSNPHDFNLDTRYYILFGGSNVGPSSGELYTHVSGSNPFPAKSEGMVNVVNDTGVVGGDHDKLKRILIQTHGILMLIAFPLLANVGIYIAVAMRQALPNGKWFQIHRVLMISSMVIAICGFVLVFFFHWNTHPREIIDVKREGVHGRTEFTHFVCGCTIILLVMINPAIALFRCHPGDKNRWIFNLLHGFPGVGTIAFVLAMANVGTGLTMFGKIFSRFGDLTLLWVYLGFGVLATANFVIRAAIKKLLLLKCSQELCLNAINVTGVDEEKLPLRGIESGAAEGDSYNLKNWCSWFSFFFTLTLAVCMVLVLSILVALPQPEN